MASIPGGFGTLLVSSFPMAILTGDIYSAEQDVLPESRVSQDESFFVEVQYVRFLRGQAPTYFWPTIILLPELLADGGSKKLSLSVCVELSLISVNVVFVLITVPAAVHSPFATHVPPEVLSVIALQPPCFVAARSRSSWVRFRQ